MSWPYGIHAAIRRIWMRIYLMTVNKNKGVSLDSDATHSEPRGYMAATQSPDNLIHLVSSRLYYCFNLAWITDGQPAPVAF